MAVNRATDCPLLHNTRAELSAALLSENLDGIPEIFGVWVSNRYVEIVKPATFRSSGIGCLSYAGGLPGRFLDE